MITKRQVAAFAFMCCTWGFCRCTKKEQVMTPPNFTRADSLMDTYLSLQDSIYKVWTVMINDDNQKISAMHDLLHELKLTNNEEQETLRAFEERLGKLGQLRYNQNSMADADVVEEYDFASNSMVTELTSLAESRTEFSYNTTLQKLVNDILAADQRVENYRAQYDLIANRFNEFLDKNKTVLLGDSGSSKMTEKKPLFQTTSDTENP
jgi:hypothetical protein